MAAPAAVLRELHRLKRHAKNLKDEIERLPRMFKAQQAKLARQEDAVKQAQETVKKLKVEASDKEKSLKAKHQDIAKFEKQRNEATAKKEYDALVAEIAAARKACQGFEEEILTSIMETEEKAGQVPELDKAVKQAKEELANFDKTSAVRQADLTAQLQEVEKQIQEVEATLPGDLVPVYSRLVAVRGEDAMALVEDRNCTSCYTSITAQQYNDLTQGMFVVCKSCGRFLYLPEQAAVGRE
jgi:uncharacterized protein